MKRCLSISSKRVIRKSGLRLNNTKCYTPPNITHTNDWGNIAFWGLQIWVKALEQRMVQFVFHSDLFNLFDSHV